MLKARKISDKLMEEKELYFSEVMELVFTKIFQSKKAEKISRTLMEAIFV
jgi:hypothetical protein